MASGLIRSWVARAGGLGLFVIAGSCWPGSDGDDRTGGAGGTGRAGGLAADSVAEAESASPLVRGAVAFAFADGDGRRLLALAPVAEPKEVTHAICARGEVFRVEHQIGRASTGGNTGRAVAANFERYGGELFQLAEGATDPDGTCLLVNEAFPAAYTIIEPTPPEYVACGGEIAERIALAKEREIAECWGLVALRPIGRQIVLVEFERRGRAALASLVAVGPSDLVLKDFPARYDPISTWRADDGGLLLPEWFRILFAFEMPDGIGFVLSWEAPEGANIDLLVERAGSFQSVVAAYRYWSPL